MDAGEAREPVATGAARIRHRRARSPWPVVLVGLALARLASADEASPAAEEASTSPRPESGDAGRAEPPCALGTVSNVDTRGHCCFPGQAWSILSERCVGIPDCPEGSVRAGESCSWIDRVPGGNDADPATRASPARAAEVGFVAAMPDFRYEIEIAGQRCRTPCRLLLPPGPNRLTASGSGRLSLDLDIGDSPGRVRLVHRRNRVLIAGLALLATGAAMTLSSVLAYVNSRSDYPFLESLFGFYLGPITTFAGLLTSVTAGALMARTNEFRPSSSGAARTRTSARARWLGLGATPTRDGFAASVAVAF